MIEQFAVENLVNLDQGKFEALFKQQSRMAFQDILNRLGLKKARSLCIEFKFNPKPVVDQEGNTSLDDLIIDYDIWVKLPKKGGAVKSTIASNGMVAYSADAPDNPRQTTCLDEEVYVTENQTEIKPC